MGCQSGCAVNHIENGSFYVSIAQSGQFNSGSCLEIFDDPNTEGGPYHCSGVGPCSFSTTTTYRINQNGVYTFMGYSGTLYQYVTYVFSGQSGQTISIPLSGRVPCGYGLDEVNAIYSGFSGSTRLTWWSVACSTCSGSGSYG